MHWKFKLTYLCFVRIAKKNVRAIIKNAQGFYTQLFDFNLLPLSGPTAAREPGSKCHATSSNCIAYMILQFKC